MLGLVLELTENALAVDLQIIRYCQAVRLCRAKEKLLAIINTGPIDVSFIVSTFKVCCFFNCRSTG